MRTGSAIIHGAVNAMKADVLADYVSKRAGDQSVTVAVLDSGVDFTHPYLSGRLLNNGFDYVESDEDPSDDYGHGTSVAGIIVDCTQGLNVNILPIKVLDYSGEGNNESIAEGIDYAIEQGADVINLSLSITENILAEPVDEAIDDAVEAGIIVVAAAGNHHRTLQQSVQPIEMISLWLLQ